MILERTNRDSARDGADSSAYDAARASWGFPHFAKEFPRDPELDALVVAFTNGDFGSVRERAPKLASAAEDRAVREAVEKLQAATLADPAAKRLVLLALGLLVLLTGWWILHDGPERPDKPAVEIVK